MAKACRPGSWFAWRWLPTWAIARCRWPTALHVVWPIFQNRPTRRSARVHAAQPQATSPRAREGDRRGGKIRSLSGSGSDNGRRPIQALQPGTPPRGHLDLQHAPFRRSAPCHFAQRRSPQARGDPRSRGGNADSAVAFDDRHFEPCRAGCSRSVRDTRADSARGTRQRPPGTTVGRQAGRSGKDVRRRLSSVVETGAPRRRRPGSGAVSGRCMDPGGARRQWPFSGSRRGHRAGGPAA